VAGKKEQVAGKMMEWEGKATGDPIRETEGKALARYGRLKGKVEQAKQSLKRKARRGSKNSGAGE
jgi:uncharacterized protein YjbJ (UPF0337 family)